MKHKDLLIAMICSFSKGINQSRDKYQHEIMRNSGLRTYYGFLPPGGSVHAVSIILEKRRFRTSLRSTCFLVGIIFWLFFVQNAMGQVSGDYRTASSGNWTSLATWQRFNGTVWATPTTAEGYPGQNTGTNDVHIQAGHTATIGSGGIVTQMMNSINIAGTGQLYLSGGNSTVNFALNTYIIDIASGGSIYFLNKARLTLTTDAVVKLVMGSGSIVGSCNNNTEIYVGSVKFAVCAGATGNVFTFSQLMSLGGTLNAVPSSNSPVCEGTSIHLSGNFTGVYGTAPTYSWSVTAPGGGTSNYTTQNVEISSALEGTYSATLTVTTILGGTTYTNSEAIDITVNPLPTLTGAAQSITVCDGSQATINLTGLVPSNTFELYYTINGGSSNTASGLTSSAPGTSSFNTIALSASNNGQNLQITGIKITNPTTNCTQSFTQNVALSVWTTGAGTWTGTTSSDWNTASNWCGGLVPGSSTNVTIPTPSASVPNQPTIGTVGGQCQNITISSGATLTVGSSSTLAVYGNWSNNGTFTPNTGTVSFVGSGSAQTIGGSGNNTFYHLTVNNANGVQAASDISVNGELNLSSANPSSTVGALEMVTDYNGYPGSTATVPIVSYTLTMGSDATTIGQGDVTGKIYRNSLNANTPYTFGNQFSNFSFSVAPSDVLLIVTIGTAYGETGVWGDPNSVQRSYEMIPAGGSGARVSMDLHYLESELNGNTEPNLVTGDYDIGGDGNPLGDEHGRSSYDFTDNFVGLSGIPIDYFIITGLHNWRTVFTLHDFYTGHTIWDGSTSGSWLTDTNWSNGVPGESMTVIIPDASTTPNDPILASGRTIGGIQILSGGILDLNNGTITISGYNYNGWEDQSGLSDYSGSTVIFSGSEGSIPVLGEPHFNNITVSSGSSLTIHANSHVFISGTFDKSGSFDASTYENIVEYNGANQSIVLPDVNNQYHNLILSGSGTNTLPASDLNIVHNLELSGTVSVTPTNSLSIGGNLTLGASTSFTAGNLTHNISGNFVNNGGVFSSSGSTFVFNGISSQTIEGSSSTTFNNLTLNNTGGVSLGIDETVDGTLNLTSGLITTGSYTLTVGSAGSISSASSASYINGKLARVYSSTGSKAFPVGKGGNYRSLSLEYTALTGTSTVAAEQIESTIGGAIPENIIVQEGRFWAITETGGSGFSYNLTLDGSSFDPGSGFARILKGDGSTNSALSATFSDPDFSITGQTSFSQFAVASECTPPEIGSQPSSASTCDGDGVAEFSVTASGSGLYYRWEESSTGLGGTFSEISDGGIYSSATSSTLSLTNPPAGMNGYAYRVVVGRDCGSNIVSDAVLLTVNELPDITLGSDPEVCYGSGTADLSYSATSGSPDQYTIDYDEAANAAGFDDISTYTALSASPLVLTLPSATGTFNGSLVVKNSTTGCESVPVTFSVTLYPLPQGSLSGNTICSGGDGQLTWTNTEGTGPFTLVYNDGTDNRTAENVSSGVPFDVFTDPIITTGYDLVSVTGNYCTRSSGFTGESTSITVSSDFIWTGSTSADWNTASNWCGSTVPTSASDVIIPSGTTYVPAIGASSTADCNDLTIEEGANLIIESSGSGTGSLISEGVISGAVVCQRYMTGNHWHLISPIASGGAINDFLLSADNAIPDKSGSYGMMDYNETGNSWNSYFTAASGGSLLPGIGYGIRRSSDGLVSFSETLTNGTKTVSLVKVGYGWNLIGNPYTSAIYMNTAANETSNFLLTNSDALDESFACIYLWDDASSTYKILGNVVFVAGRELDINVFAPGQAFFVKAGTHGASIEFNRNMQTHATDTEFKSDHISWPGIVLNVKNSQITASASIAFNEKMTTGLDVTYDAGLLRGNSGLSIYTRLVEDNGIGFAIQCLPDKFDSLLVPVGIDSKVGGEITFSTETIQLSSDFKIILEDRQTGMFVSLSEGETYQVNIPSAISGTGRFFLHLSQQQSGLSKFKPDSEIFLNVYSSNETIYINGNPGQSARAYLFDLSGRCLEWYPLPNRTRNVINTHGISKGIYILHVNNEGRYINQKISIQ